MDCPVLQAGQPLSKEYLGEISLLQSRSREAKQSDWPRVQAVKGSVISCRYHSETFQAGK